MSKESIGKHIKPDFQHSGLHHIGYCLTLPLAFLALLASCAMHRAPQIGASQSPAAPQPLGNTAYYVDPVAGRDANAGVSPGKAWKTLARVNSEMFQPGDKVLLKAGGVWNGESLSPQGSGTESKPILLSRYGIGGDPKINADMTAEAAVQIDNQEYWEISHLEITNDSDLTKTTDTGHFLGILFMLDKPDEILHHIFISHCFIHDVDGDPNYQGPDDKTSGGISGRVRCPEGAAPGRFEQVRITDNHIMRVSRSGIFLHGSGNARIDQYCTRIYIGGNTVDLAAGDGVVLCYVDHALVEHNTILRAHDRSTAGCAGLWGWFVRDTIYQYNECAFVKPGPDSEAWDFDLGNHNVVYQYNYSHDNPNGWILLMANPDDSDLVCRYNISANELIGRVQGTQATSQMYNNVFYRDTGILDKNGLPAEVGFATAYNNLFYDCKDIAFLRSDAKHDYNAYYNSGGDHGEAHAVTADPQILGPLTEGIQAPGLSAAGIFRLKPTSPLVGAGTPVPGAPDTGFLGKPSAGKINIGASQ